MRYTIPGRANDRARVVVRNRPMPRGEWWAIVRRGDLLNGLMGRDHLPPVHRERVRFGAWEESPSGQVSDGAAWRALPAEVRAAFLDKGREIARSAGWGPEPPEWVAEGSARAMLSLGRWAAAYDKRAGRVPVEGPPISGPENTYKCEGER